MKNYMLLAVVGVTTLVLVRASTGEDHSLYTLELANGRFWAQFSPESKIAFVAGFQSGAFIQGVDDYAPMTLVGKTVIASKTRDEQIKFIDLFFRDPANEAIPIAYAIRIWRMENDGYKKKNIDRAIKMLRKEIGNDNVDRGR